MQPKEQPGDSGSDGGDLPESLTFRKAIQTLVDAVLLLSPLALGWLLMYYSFNVWDGAWTLVPFIIGLVVTMFWLWCILKSTLEGQKLIR